jgi:hypothetical protein
MECYIRTPLRFPALEMPPRIFCLSMVRKLAAPARHCIPLLARGHAKRIGHFLDGCDQAWIISARRIDVPTQYSFHNSDRFLIASFR